jgi:hypothetical protein
MELIPAARCNMGDGGRYEADISRIIPRCDLNFWDQILLKEGRVVTLAFLA